ncbi:MAG TPA: methyltransferase domain-containing protein [Acidimicrobiia bacterium]|nr:methyltransferase domain-containing protein [Acidimicrobiia bacterium]
MNRFGRFLPRRAQDAVHMWRVQARDRLLFGGDWDIRNALPDRFVRAAYQIILRRDPDPGGLQNYLRVLEERKLTPDGVLDEMLTSMELRGEVPFRNILRSLHQSRCDFVRMLPRASRILDLGGTDQAEDAGALVSMGYPYQFESLTIVDLPNDERHELYGYMGSSETVGSRCGPVQYRYHSMADLSPYPDGAFDLVFSGQTIEHITEDEAVKMLAEVRRVLAPGGWFCLDTPNRRVTALQLGPDTLSNPDHKLEYTHEHLSALLRDAGFEIVGEYGLSLANESLADARFDTDEVAAKHGVFAEIADCYFLAYFCRSPL